jgi:transcription-repair coupling factor (superfamily II helicase)
MRNSCIPEADILVATTIIENGLDIPLCNTIFINRRTAGAFGLYQLRPCRAVRSPGVRLPSAAFEIELRPLRVGWRRSRNSNLGAGFKIAALDLELRGAGNMLGGEPADTSKLSVRLYARCSIAPRNSRGEMRKKRVRPAQSLNIRIPAEYIQENQRLRMAAARGGSGTREAQLHDVRPNDRSLRGTAARRA